LQVITPSGSGDADDAASIARSSGVTHGGGGDVATGTTPAVVPLAEEVRRLAVGEGEQPDDTALLFRRDEAGRQCWQRAADDFMTPADVACLPPCFHGLLEHLRSPNNRATGDRVKSADYVNMIDEDGQPRLFTCTITRRKLGKIAKGKAPSFSGDGPGLYASLPGEWLDWAVELANII
jgi:hypothetical protein